MSLFQGLAGNLTEISTKELESEYGKYLTEGETMEIGFKLVRDVLIFTNKRIIDFDKQGATGKKMSVESIYLNRISEVSCETAGFGIDDSEIEIKYIASPYWKALKVDIKSKKYEFPKKFDFAPLYVKLETIAQQNINRLNELG